VPLKEADRALKREFGRGDHLPGDSYTELKERIADELYGKVDAEDRVIQERKENLHAIVRGQVEREMEAKSAELEDWRAGLERYEAGVAAREREASPSYRAAFFTVGAFLALSTDLLIRLVA
jgi:hypothetical protein